MPRSRLTARTRHARDLLFVRCPRRIRRALRWHLLRDHGVALTRFALAAGVVIAPGLASANPSGAQVAAGSVQMHGSLPGVLDIQQSSAVAIINWQSFNIALGETVNFIQPSLNSVALNRVLGNDPSAIFGRLQANGTVMLVNPNGIVFGASSRVDVGGLVATTANVRDADLLAGRLQFGQASTVAGASIVNAGQISIKDSGLAALVAPRVHNSGLIEARLGRIMLGGAERFTLDFQQDGLLSFSAGTSLPTKGQTLVSNTGTLRADGGTVLLSAQAVQGVVDNVINTTGLIAATSVGDRAGRIVLDGGDAGTVQIGGTLDASGRQTGQQGGLVQATGAAVQVQRGALLDVSGHAGGGEIALGSRGRASQFADKSQSTHVAAGATLRADALVQGDGGSITAWSSDTTVFAGHLSAQGGSAGGDGGFAEISSQKNIGLTGTVALKAPHGQTGLLLLDPTDLRITDSASGGSQDGNAGDNTVGAGDANQGSGSTLNTVSRGLLESLSGSANIVLQATGQITVDAMAGGVIDLATTTGHSVTLQSTQTGGIRFVDAQTEIRTQGGDITLEATGIGSTLSNIGKLSSNGGDITLLSTGNITLAGQLNAGSGSLSANSTVGSIANAAGSAPLLTGGTVQLTAAGGHIGASGSAMSTHTSHLALQAGGNIHAGSDQALTNLSVTAGHVSSTAVNTYQVSAPGLAFQVTDGASLGVTQISQSGLDLTLSADRTLQMGTVNLGSGDLTLSSTGGNLLGGSGSQLTAGTASLSASGSNGNNGAIGISGQALNTTTGHLTATTGSGGAYLANTGALALDRLSSTGSASVTSTGTLTAGSVSAGSATLTLGSTGGSLLDDGDSSTRITAGTLNLTAGGAIGSSGTRVSTNASSLSANAASGGIYASTSATSSVLSSITSGNGAIDITTGGTTTLTSLTSSTSSASNDITVSATGTGSLSVGTVNAGSLGDVNLSTTSGSISGNTGLITGNTVTINAANSGSVSVRTAASHLDVQAGSSSISITQTGSVTLDRISTPSTIASVTSSSGDITVGSVSTATSGQVTLTASAGAILDDGNSATRISTGTASLSASGDIGSASHAVQTRATGLTVTNTGDLFVTNTDATLTSLSITNRHASVGVANTLLITSPYLTFDVTDSGTQYALDRVVGVPLGSFAFSGDQTVQVGQVQASGSVSLTATQGHLVDDGNLNSRVTSGSTLTLSAAQGSVGTSSNPIGVNAASLALTTRGDLYVTDLTDLSTLTVTSSHADTSTSYGMAITAPSLKFSVSDSAAGHAVHTLTDNSSLSLTFNSDRDITLGQVDVTHTGTARFTSTGGAIKDDGNKSTRVLANSTTLSGSAVGATGADHMDVVTGTLAATATAGGVYVEVPMPTGSTNTTSTVTLGTITATGPVAITALEGDLSLGGYLTATNQSVSLTATQGSILSPSSYSIGIGTGSLTLEAAQTIGSSGNALPVTSSSGATLNAQAGTSMWISGSGAMNLSSLEAASGITYTQSSGAITVGHVDATAGGTVAITASSGAIQNDSDNATGIRANQVTLSAAQSSIGAGTAITVDAPKLLLTALGAVNVSDSATLETLSLTRGTGSSGSIAISGVAGQSFTISEDSSTHYVESVSSSTPLAFSFSGQRDVKIGHIDVGSTGSASISSAASLTNDGTFGASIAAGTVALSAGTAGSIGTTDSAINLEGTTALTLSTGRNAFVANDTALTDLAITSTNTTTAAGTASEFGLSGLGQTFSITDSGTTQSLEFLGTSLTNASFTTRKNIEVSSITATGDVTLSTSGGGANSNISSDSGTGRIAGNRVLLTASSTTAGGGSIGSSGTALRVDTPTLILTGSANVYVNDAQNLARLDMTLSHGTNTTYGYGVTAGNLNSFTITDGSTQSLGLAVSGAMDFAYSVDRALSLATLDAGTSTTGSLSLTSRGAPSGTGAQINRSSGSLTGGTITLSATGSNGGVGAGATLSTNTKNLSIATGGNVSVSNSTTLTSLALDARHNTSGSSTHSYSISSTGLTFSISDTLGNNAFQLSNLTQTSLDLTVKADRVITASSVNTGASGKVTLQSSSYIQGGSGASAGSPSITTGDLTLNGGSAFGYQGSTPLYTAAGTLSSSLSNTLYLSNAGALTLKTNTVGSSADVASSNNSLLQGVGGLFTTPTLKLSANQSLGSNDTLLTDARRLTVVARNHIDISNASDLYALTMTSTHATPGVQNTISVAAPRLALTLTDSVGGNQYHLSNLVDSTGLDFTLSTDVDLNLGTVNAQAGRSLALYSTGSTTSITNDGSSLLSAGSILLSAGGSIGAAGGSGTRMQTDALALTLATGANTYADNAQDLTSLSLTSSQTTGGTAPVYQVTAPSLNFDITDDGTTHINHVADSTGLNFVLDTQRDQAVGSIDVGRSGTVSLTGSGDILGDADSSHRINAASATFYATNGGAVGSVGNPIRLSAPLTSFAVTGALNVESDTHIDSLTISTTHPTVSYGGTYSIVSVPITGAAYPLFTATDSVTGTALTSLNDPLGLAFSFTSDSAMQLGTLNLGTTGTVVLTGTGSGGILGDGDPDTLVQAASLSMTSYGGAVGATGSGNGIDATVNTISATAQGGGVNLALHGQATLGTISATGGVNLTQDEGDIALGVIDAGGNAVNINNQGGSIVSGSIANATTVSLTASGSIGNTSAIGTSANGGGTTTLTASASAAHGASGSIAISESYNLFASSITAPDDVSLDSGYDLSVGTVTSGGAVGLGASQGSIVGINGSNAITGTSVTLSARYGTGNGIGSSGTRLNLNTPELVLNTPGSIYVTDSADLSLLTIDRTNYTGTGSSGTLSVIASGLTFSATDSSDTTTLTSLADSTGLDFSYLGIGSLSIGSLNVGSGSMLLQAYLSGGDGNINAINGSSLITAGNLTLQAYGTDSNIGSSGTALGLAVGSLNASAGSGGMVLTQAGSLNLSSLSTTGDLAVTATSGDLTLGTLSYGSSSTLTLTASNGSILAGGGTLAGNSANAAITLSAANGIGTELAPILVNASGGHTVSANVTGTGSLFLSSLGTLNGGLSTSVHDGATTVTAAGNIALTAMSSDTDAVGNDITVTASAGNITVTSATVGSQAGSLTLAANAGRINATSGATLSGYDVSLHGATGVGDTTNRISASGQRVQVTSDGGALYLGATAASVLSYVASNGGLIDISTSADLLLANVLSNGGNIVVSATGADTNILAGALNAGSGSVTLTSAGGAVLDDDNTATQVAGASVSLTGSTGVGTAQQALQTSAGTLTIASSGGNIHVDDQNASGVTLSSVVASNGSVNLSTAGATVASSITAGTDADGNDIHLSVTGGDLTLGSLTAGSSHGEVHLSASGSILGSGSGTHITGQSASLAAGGDIGTVTDLATGAGTPITLNVSTLAGLSSSGSNRVVSVNNLGTTALALGGSALSLGSGSSAYISTAGDLDVSAGIALANGNLSLAAGGTLTLPTTALSTTGAVRLSGSTDIVTAASGAAARELQVTGSSLYLRSGAAGGDTQITSTVGSIDAQLSGAGDLTVSNTGSLTAATLQTADGNISASSSTGLTASSVIAGGTGHTITLSATSGNLTVGTLNASSTGTLNLSAAQGSLFSTSSAHTASLLNLSSGTGIGSSGTAFETVVSTVSAQVTGNGDIHLASGGNLTLTQLSTHNGDITVTATGDISTQALSAGQSGDVTLTSSGGDITLTQAYSQTGSDSSRAGLTLQGTQINLLDVSTTGAQSYTGAVAIGGNLSGRGVQINGDATLSGADRTLAAGSGALNITGLLTGDGHAANLTGASVTLGGAASGLSTLSATASSIQLAGVSTTGAQTYTGDLSLAGNLSGQGVQIDGDATLSGADRTLAAGTGALQITGTLTGDGHGASLTGTSVTLGGAASGLSSLSATASSIELAGASTTGAQTYTGDLSLAGNLSGQGVQINGDITLSGADRTLAAGSGALHITGTLTGDGHGASLSGTSVTLGGTASGLSTLSATASSIQLVGASTTGAQTYTGNLSLGGDLSGQGLQINGNVSLSGADRNLAAGGGTLQITGTLTGDGHAVNLTGTSVTLGGAASGLSTLSATASSIELAGASTTGAQTYNGDLSLAGNLSGQVVQINGDATLSGADRTLAAGSGVLQITGTLTGDGHGASLTGTSVTLGGTASGLSTLSATASSIQLAGASTTGAQTYTGDVTLSGADRTLAAGNGALHITGTLTGDGHGASLSGTSVTLGGAASGLSTLSATASNIQLAGVSTTGAQTYNGDLSLTGNLSGQGLQISGDVTLSGADRTLTAGSGAIQITGQLTGDGHAVNLTGTSVTLGDTASGLSSLSVTASSIQLAGASTTGAQTYTGSTTLAGSYATQGGAFQVIGDTQLGAATSVATQGGAASFGGTLDGASNLSVNTGAGDADFSGAVGQTTRLASLTVDSVGATRFGGAIRAASLSTDAAGTLAMDGGSVNTTGTQTYGERLVLGADTVLTGSTVTLNAGVDAATSAGQTLIIAGDAVLNGQAGAQQALGSLHITGSSTLASGGSITTMGDQQYDGAVQLLGNQQLRSVQGDLRFLSTLDGSDGANLTLTSEAGAIALAGAVGGSGLLGALTVSAATTLDFSGAVHVDEITTTDTTGLTRFLGSLQADGVGGISLSGGSFSFAQTVTASQGALTVANTDASGTLDFAAAAHVHTATGFVQTGGAGITLPASVLVDRGPITLAAPATLPTGAARIETEGDITLSSLIGTSSQLTLASGHGPVAGSGLPYSLEAGHLQIGFIDVAGLTVTDAKSAELFGRIAGKDGALAASLIDTRLVNAPYFINGTPWGPLDVINTLVATTVPRSVVASTPGAGPLFTRTISSGSLAPDALSVFAEPQVLSVPERDDKSSASPL